MERSSWWLHWSSLGLLKASFNIPSDDQGTHPDDLSVSLTDTMLTGIVSAVNDQSWEIDAKKGPNKSHNVNLESNTN